MRAKLIDHKRAVELRQLGMSYSAIKKELKVSKSTLSLWLKSINLTEDKRINLTNLFKEGRLKGAKTRHLNRMQSTREITQEAVKMIGNISKRELWLLGIMAY
jgi:transposase